MTAELKPIETEMDRLQFEIDKLKTELAETNGQWSRMYDEKEKYKSLARDLAVTIKTMNSIEAIEKELRQ